MITILKLRAERAGNGDGRIYTVKFHVQINMEIQEQELRLYWCRRICLAKDIRLLVFQNWSQGHGHGHRFRRRIGSQTAKILVTLNEQDPENSTFISVYPNPSTSNFTINIETFNDKEKISVRLIDVAGRIIETRNNLSGSQVVKDR